MGIIANIARYAANEIKRSVSDTLNMVRELSPAAIPAAGYILETSDKFPSLTQGDHIALSAAFGVATLAAVNVGEEIGQKVYEVAHAIVPPDEQTSRYGCFATNFIGGMTGAVLATTIAFNAINDQPERVEETYSDVKSFIFSSIPEQGK